MMTYRAKGLLVEEIWFDDEPQAKADVRHYYQRSSEIVGATNTLFHTLVVNVTPPPEDIIKGFDSNTRNEVRRARDKDGVVAEFIDGKEDTAFREFCELYDTFASAKKLDPLDLNKLQRMREDGRLLLTKAIVGDEPLVWHAYLTSSHRNRLLFSASLFRANEEGGARQLMGRANRFLHFADMVEFRDHGVEIYDFGGWYSGTDDADKLRINGFKQGFGGVTRAEYNINEAVTLLGKTATRIKKLIS